MQEVIAFFCSILSHSFLLYTIGVGRFYNTFQALYLKLIFVLLQWLIPPNNNFHLYCRLPSTYYSFSFFPPISPALHYLTHLSLYLMSKSFAPHNSDISPVLLGPCVSSLCTPLPSVFPSLFPPFNGLIALSRKFHIRSNFCPFFPHPLYTLLASIRRT